VISGSVAEKMHTCVVAAGLIYDDSGGVFQDLFKYATFRVYLDVYYYYFI
jgi:hypothetical protein